MTALRTLARGLMTRQEVAEFLGIEPKTLAKWASLGQGPTYRRVGKYSRYRLEDVLAWVEEQPRGGAA